MINRLFIKITLPIVALMMLLGVSWYVVVLRTVHDFTSQNIHADLKNLSSQLFDVADRGFMELLKNGAAGDKISVRIQQVDCLDIIERSSFAQNFKILIYKEQNNKILLASDFTKQINTTEIIQRSQQTLNSAPIPIADKKFHTHQFHFSPWDWTFLVLKDTQAYVGLTDKVRNLYYISAVVLLICTALLVWYLFHSIKKPISSIISAVSKENPPEYQGTYEFEFLAKTIKNMMRSLQNSKNRYRALIDNAPIGIALVTQKGVITEANKAASDITGYSLDELGDINAIDLYKTPDERKKILKETSNKSIARNELNFKRKDGTTFIGNFTTVDVIIDNEPMILSMFEDITGQKEAEQEHAIMETSLRRAQKMETIGMMAGGVAHDLNNILSGIVGYPEVLLLQLPAGSKLRGPLKAIHESGKRAGTVVEDLLTVARGAAATREVHNLSALAQEYLDSPECRKLTSLYPQVTLQQQYKATKAAISCSPVHIKKCLMNLVTNAAEAILGKGTIIISTYDHHVHTSDSSPSDLPEGHYSVLSVCDSGSGISEQDLEHIFEPFYTRKVMGRSGTGLGLAVVWNTMEDHDGRVQVASNAEGTCFQLYFPTTSEKEEKQTDTVNKELVTGNGEHILVVDDEVLLRDIASQMLQHLGYKVNSVDSGETAIQFMQKNSVDLIILDILMDPGINGKQTYEEILKLHPNQKAIVASGFSESDDVKATLQLGANGFIKKPYSVDVLSRTVHKALQG